MKHFFLPFLALALVLGCNLSNNERVELISEIPGKIVFSMPDSTESENHQIFVMNADGSDINQLTYFENNEAYEPSWSPDGKQIVFTSSMRSTSLGFAIFFMDANGDNIKPMKFWPDSIHAYAGSNPTWSPDGSKIAFDWCTNCELYGRNYEVFIYDFETDTVTQITEHSAGDRNPSWSSDGEQVVFSSRRDYYDADTLRYRTDLYIINSNGFNLQRITNSGYATKPQWHPKELIIAYQWNIQGNKVYLLDLESKEAIDIETTLEFEGDPKWSINGGFLILFGRSDENALPKIQLFKFKNNQLIFNVNITDNPIFLKGRSFDWYYDENK